MVHQYLAAVGDTYWVQRQATPTLASGTVITINNTAPTTGRYNLSIVEILPSLLPASSFQQPFQFGFVNPHVGVSEIPLGK